MFDKKFAVHQKGLVIIMNGICGNKLKVSVFGESHGSHVGVVLEGFPAGFEINFGEVQRMISRRATAKNEYSSARREADIPEVISGVTDGVTNGFPITAVFRNGDCHSSDYTAENIRPGHADYTAFIKYGGNADMRGGGHFSGRLTLPLVFAGSLCLQYLKKINISVAAHAVKIYNILDDAFDALNPSPAVLDGLQKSEYPVINPLRLAEMQAAVRAAAEEGDSVGGTVECAAVGVPAGLGAPMFGRIESQLSYALFSVPAVRGVEFGAGFGCTELRGSECNDGIRIKDGRAEFLSNNCGGVNGGITNGQPILFRAAFRPTPSISKTQRSINCVRGENIDISVRGRHDPCIVFRAVPVVESVAALVLCDNLL